MAKINGFRVRNFGVLKDVTLGRLWNASQANELASMTAVIGKNGTERAMMPSETSYFYRFAPQLIDIQKTIEGKNYQPFDIVRKKFELFITEYYSHYERDGAPVKVGTVTQDWTYPLWKPDWYDNSDFKD